MSPRRLILLRHGRTAWNAERRIQGHLDPPLDEVGRAQAYEVGLLIAALQPDLMVSSVLKRAVQTASIVGEVAGRPFTTDIRFQERGLGHWEGLTLDEVAVTYPDEFARWSVGHDVERADGETRDEVAARALAALADLPEVPLTVVVTHGATAMATCNALLGISQRVHPLGSLANCHWSELDAVRAPEGATAWRLRGHNLGVPGVVVPVPNRADGADDNPDADV